MTYGTSCAPYLTMSTWVQCAIDEGSNFYLTSSIIRNDIYLRGWNIDRFEWRSSALQLQSQLLHVMRMSYFEEVDIQLFPDPRCGSGESSPFICSIGFIFYGQHQDFRTGLEPIPRFFLLLGNISDLPSPYEVICRNDYCDLARSAVVAHPCYHCWKDFLAKVVTFGPGLGLEVLQTTFHGGEEVPPWLGDYACHLYWSTYINSELR